MLTPTYAEDKTKEFFVLTDGGDSENLGVYGLIQRKCKNIVVVDAEYDGEIGSINETFYGKSPNGYKDGYRFGSYQRLKDNLSKDSQTLMIDRLSLKSLEDQAAASEKSANPRSWNCLNKDINTNRTLFDCAEPITTGDIHRCLDDKCIQTEQLDMHVTYVKLSANRKLLDASSSGGEGKAKAEAVYGPGITNFYEGLINNKMGKSEYTDFPHYSTFKLNLDTEAFLAIAELGCRAVTRHYDQKNAPKVFRQSEDACTLLEKSPEGTGDKK